MRKIALLLVVFAGLASPTYAAPIPPGFFSAVVALGSPQQEVVPGQPCTVQWHTEGTGFLYGYLVEDNSDPAKRRYEVFLVTNRHIIEEHIASQIALKRNSNTATQQSQPIPGCPPAPTRDETSIGIRLNRLKSSTEGKQFTVPITDGFFHPDRKVDIAAVRLNGKLLREQDLLDVLLRTSLLHFRLSQDNSARNRRSLRRLRLFTDCNINELHITSYNTDEVAIKLRRSTRDSG